MNKQKISGQKNSCFKVLAIIVAMFASSGMSIGSYGIGLPTTTKDLKTMPANMDKIVAKLKAQGLIPEGASEKEIKKIVDDYLKKEKKKKNK